MRDRQWARNSRVTMIVAKAAMIAGFSVLGWMAVSPLVGAQERPGRPPIPHCEMDLCVGMTECEDTKYARVGCARDGGLCSTYSCPKLPKIEIPRD